MNRQWKKFILLAVLVYMVGGTIRNVFIALIRL